MRPLLVSLLVLALGTGIAAAHLPGVLEPERSLAGRLLVATPSLDDPNFRESVVFLAQHDDTGAMGLIVNRVLAEGPLAELLDDLGVEAETPGNARIRVYQGGPVDRRRPFVLHSDDYVSPSSMPVRGGYALTGSLDVLRDIAAGRGPRHSLMALGYAGWAPDQLERELAAGAWVVVPAERTLVFAPDAGTVWRRAWSRRGVDL